MAQAQAQILIERPVGEVWRTHTMPQTITQISVNTTRYEPRGPMARGTRILGATKVIGRTVEWEAEVAEFVELRGYRLRSIVAPMQWELAYSYRPIGNATMVLAQQTAFGLEGFFGRISEALIVRKYRRDLGRNLANLKTLIESVPVYS